MSIKLAWKDLDWKLVQKRLSRQQRRVYKASIEGNRAKVHGLQRRIIGSLDARLLAVQHVTSDIDNKSSNIGDVYRKKAISNEMKLKLAFKLKLDGKAFSIIKNSILDKKEIHPLIMSLIEDKAKQALAKFALEPEWEAIFEPNSYGFRTGSLYNSAIAPVFLSMRGKCQYILDVKKCFDQLDHEKLLTKLGTFDQIKSQIRAWLRAGIIIEYLNRTEQVIQLSEGSAQGGIISPLLAKITLHGLEKHINEWHARKWYASNDLIQKFTIRDWNNLIRFSRYADNFVITAPKFWDVQQIEKQIEIWVSKEAGLSMSNANIKIVNSTEGFDFLGFHLISLKSNLTDKYKLKIHPSKSSKQHLINQTQKIIQANRSASSYTLISLLTSKIIGWANYFKYSECHEDFSKIDNIIFQQARAWVFRRKSTGLRARNKLKEKYFPSSKIYVFRGNKYKSNWILVGQTLIKGQKQENFLPKMVWISSSQHTKVKTMYHRNYIYCTTQAKKYSGYNLKLIKLQ